MREKVRRSVYIPSLKQVDQERNRLFFRLVYRSTLCRLGISLIVIMVLAVWLAAYWFPVLQVTDSGKVPGFENEELVVLDKLGRFHPGDYCALLEEGRISLERVIATPGDYVDVDENGTVSVNGQMLEGDFRGGGISEKNGRFICYISESEYLIWREYSGESPGGSLGLVQKDQVLGKVWLRIWPFENASFIKTGIPVIETEDIKTSAFPADDESDFNTPVVTILNYDADNILQPLAGASFAMVEGTMEDDVFVAADPRRVWTGRTDREGKLSFGLEPDQPLRSGMVYEIRENMAPSGYYRDIRKQYFAPDGENDVFSCQIASRRRAVFTGFSRTAAERVPMTVTVPAAALTLVFLLLACRRFRYRRNMKRLLMEGKNDRKDE